MYPIVFAEDESQHYNVSLDVLDLLYNFPQFGSMVHEQPKAFVETMRGMLLKAQENTIQGMQGQSRELNEPTRKLKVDPRLINVPPCAEFVTKRIRDLDQRHLNKLVVTFGTVMRCTNVNSRELRKKFQCKNCQKEYICESSIEEFN